MNITTVSVQINSDKSLKIMVIQGVFKCDVILVRPSSMPLAKWQTLLDLNNQEKDAYFLHDDHGYAVIRTEGSNIEFSILKWNDKGGSVSVRFPKQLVAEELLKIVSPLYD